MGLLEGGPAVKKNKDPLWALSSAKQIQNHVGKKVFDNYLKLYAVRNPFDKVVSWFWHVMPLETKNVLNGDFEKTKQLFQAWIQMRPNLPVDLQFYKINSLEFEAFHIRYQSLSKDLLKIADRLGDESITGEIKNWKTGVRKNHTLKLSEYYNEAAVKVVRNKFKHDFESFGYSRDVPPG